MKANQKLKENPRIYCVHYNQCDPKKCSALKLKKFNLITFIPKIDKKLKHAIVLTPFSNKQISLEDRKIILEFGLIVLDCSWKNVLNISKEHFKNGRRLPSFIAANPTNYGKWEKLSSVEAIAAALYITEFEWYAKFLLSKFSWGEEFLKLNFN